MLCLIKVDEDKMFKFLENLGLPVPSKLEIILFVLLLLSVIGLRYQWNQLQDKDEIIKGKEVEISVQATTIETLRTETLKSVDKINAMNDMLSKTESEYQQELNKLISEIGSCKSNAPVSELEEKAQKSFQGVLDGLANSTVKKR